MDMCVRRNHFFAALALVMCITALPAPGSMSAATAVSLAQPPSINRLVNVTTEFTPQQRQQVTEYAEYWSAELLSSDMEQARLAKRRLLEPFGLLGVRRVFRDEYARAAIPELREVLETDNTFAAVNAVQVASEFRNDAALDVMRDRCRLDREPRWQIRLWAARGLGRVAGESEDIPDRTIESAVRDLTRAGENETHWLVLQRQFEALAEIGTDAARESQVTLLRSTLARIADDTTGPSELMQPVHRALLLLRSQFLDPGISRSQLRSLGMEVGPLLGQVFEIGVMHWEAADADDRLRAPYDSAMTIAESLLELIDIQVRGSDAHRPQIATSWGNGNKSNFEADVSQWRQVLGAPPYAQR